MVDIGVFNKWGGVTRFDLLDFPLLFCASCLRGGFDGYADLSIVGAGVGVACMVQTELAELRFGFVWEGIGRLADR